MPRLQRSRSNGQKAIVPGMMSNLNPQLPGAACGSIRFTPARANGTAKASPQARYAPSRIKSAAILCLVAKTGKTLHSVAQNATRVFASAEHFVILAAKFH